MYKQAGGAPDGGGDSAGPASGGPGSGGGKDDVIDAEFEDKS